jgi:uncharacterized membrane protein
MRKIVKLLHVVASCGLVGALMGYAIVLYHLPGEASRYADARQVIGNLSNYLLLPSLALSLISGLFSMVAHRPFLDKRWVWVKALLGLSMFEATLGVVQSKANYASEIATQIAAGVGSAESLKNAVAHEWTALLVISLLSLANFVLGIWRPKLHPLPWEYPEKDTQNIRGR